MRAALKPLSVVAAGVAIQLAACTDDPTRPLGGAAAEPLSHLALTSAERGDLSAAFAFAREQALRGLQRRDAADRVAVAFVDVAARVEAGDRAGAERALAAARGAIEAYRRHATEDGGTSDADLEALSLTLERATAIVREGSASSTSLTTTNLER